MKILIVDDSKNGALVLQMRLLEQGYNDVHVEYSAKEAFKYLETLPPESACQLILMDINMPEMDGIEATQWLKKHEKYKDIPVVMVSGDEDIERLKQAFNAGAYDFIRKSSEETELIARVKSVLRLKQEMEHRIAHEKELQSLTEKYKTKAIEAEMANRAKAQFLANMSHEIRTPMNAITGMTSLAINENKSPLVHRYLKTIQNSSQLLLALLNDILDISRIDAGRLKMETTQFNFRTIMEQSATIFGSKASAKDIELILSIDNRIPDQLIGDPHRFNQILNNLISNAIKFTSEGYVEISAQMLNQEPKKIKIQFEVKDTGTGIDSSSYDELFESFTQADSSITRKYGGTGLGLAICKNLVELMDGKIWIESKLNEGSTFIFTAYFSLPESQPEKEALLPLDDAFSNLSFIVLDDNPVAGAAVIGTLESIGLSGTLVQNEQILIDQLSDIHEPPVDLIFLDNSFTDTDGLTIAKNIRHNISIHQPQIILMSAIGIVLPDELTQESGIQSVVNKPLSRKSVADAIINAIKPELLKKESPDQSSASYKYNNISALLVEDDDINIDVCIGLLKSVNIHKIDVAKNGLEGFELIKKAYHSNKKYDFILMDVQMPIMDGLEATRKVRNFESSLVSLSNQENLRIPIIATTAHAMEEDKNRCIEAGMDDYVTKPIPLKDLYRVINKFACSKRLPLDLVDDQTNNLSLDTENQTQHILNPKEAISRFNGNEALYFQLLQKFMEEYINVDKQIKEALDKNDLETAHRLAHTTKGLAANLAAPKFTEASRDLEYAIKEKQNDKIDYLFTNFKTEFQRLFKEIKKVLPTEGHPAQEDQEYVEKEQTQKDSITLPQISEINIQEALKRFAGNFDLFMQVLRRFYDDYQTFSSQIREAYITDNLKKVQEYAHRLKGVASYLASESLLDAAKKLEKYVIDKQYEKITPIITSIEDIISRIITSLKNVIQSDQIDNSIVLLPQNIHDRFITLYKLLKESDSEIKDMINDFEQSLSKISLSFSARQNLKKMVREINSYQFDNAKKSLQLLAENCNVQFADKEVIE
ncbi:multi-sensor hybrid histidine kinase [Candidatus Magnetomorum sp. HK-1]|nr:multi-sensor hybrid histidine kinase [Candidatus Magnetomorum sp. HK-1]